MSPPTSRAPPIAIAELLGAAVLLGSDTPAAALAGRALPLHVGSSVRMLAALAVLAPIVWSRRSRVWTLPWRVHATAATIAALSMYVFTVALLAALGRSSSGSCSVALGGAPPLTAVAAGVWLRERVGWRDLAAAGLAGAGVVAAHLDGTTGTGSLGALACLAVALLGLVAWTILGKVASSEADPDLVTSLVALYTLPLFAVPALAELPTFDPWAVPARTWAWTAWWGIGGYALGTLLWFRGVARVPGVVAAAFSGGIAASAVVLSWVLVGEAFGWGQVVGLLLVVAGIAVAAREPSGT